VARALAVDPRLIVLDEPISALDVSIQAQLINLLNDLQQRLGVSYVLISRDLGVERYIADRVAVMYLGRIVETGAVDAVVASPRHPYTRLLLEAAGLDEQGRDADRSAAVDGEPPSPMAPPSGCAFHPRCPLATDLCRRERPQERMLGGAVVACHVATA
jgi:oligopeptide/dipeptide ABC transporter ATP-binding protein